MNKRQSHSRDDETWKKGGGIYIKEKERDSYQGKCNFGTMDDGLPASRRQYVGLGLWKKNGARRYYDDQSRGKERLERVKRRIHTFIK